MTKEPPIPVTLIDKLESLIKKGTPGGLYVAGFDDGVQSCISIITRHNAELRETGIFDQPWHGEPGHYHTPDPIIPMPLTEWVDKMVFDQQSSIFAAGSIDQFENGKFWAFKEVQQKLHAYPSPEWSVGIPYNDAHYCQDSA
jgi:hypothetical protein